MMIRKGIEDMFADHGSREVDNVWGRMIKSAPHGVESELQIHPEDPLFEHVLERAVREKGDFEHDYRILLPDASVKFVRSVGQSFVNPSGELEFIGTLMDVTVLKRARELQIALAREREHFAQQRAASWPKQTRRCADASMRLPRCPHWTSSSGK
jgi:hypothetical protein